MREGGEGRKLRRTAGIAEERHHAQPRRVGVTAALAVQQREPLLHTLPLPTTRRALLLPSSRRAAASRTLHQRQGPTAALACSHGVPRAPHGGTRRMGARPRPWAAAVVSSPRGRARRRNHRSQLASEREPAESASSTLVSLMRLRPAPNGAAVGAARPRPRARDALRDSLSRRVLMASLSARMQSLVGLVPLESQYRAARSPSFVRK
jgi:hypothetical protein